MFLDLAILQGLIGYTEVLFIPFETTKSIIKILNEFNKNTFYSPSPLECCIEQSGKGKFIIILKYKRYSTDIINAKVCVNVCYYVTR